MRIPYKTYSNEGNIVSDFTMGSGTFVIACIYTNKKYLGIEKDKDIFKIVKERVDGHFKRKKINDLLN